MLKGSNNLLIRATSQFFTKYMNLQAGSSYFENENVFPKGSVNFDNALLMTGIEHEWSSLPDKECC